MFPETNMKKTLSRSIAVWAALLFVNGAPCRADNPVEPGNAPEADQTLVVTRDPHAFATLNREFTWELAWRPERPIAAGSEIELRTPNLRNIEEWNYSKIEVVGDAAIAWRRASNKDVTTVTSFFENGLALVRFSLPHGLTPGQSVAFRLTAQPPYWSDLEERLSIWIARPQKETGGLRPTPQYVADPRASAVLRAGPGPVERLAVYCHPMPGPDGKVRTVLAPEDRYGNLSEFQREIPVQLRWDDKTWTEKAKAAKIIELDAPTDVGRLTASVAAKTLALAENISNGRWEGGRIVVVGNPVWRNSPNGKTAAFGDFHWHTELSFDGGGPLPLGMRLGRDHLNMDYCMSSDHTPSPEQWKHYVSVLDQWNQPDRFATIYSYENSNTRGAGHEGHDNFYFLDADSPVKPPLAAELAGKSPFEIQDQLSQLQAGLDEYHKFIAIPHHTNCPSESVKADGTPYWTTYRFTKPDNFHRLIEIFQCRGNMERNEYSDVWRGWYANGCSVQDALALGYKVGFTAGTDCHVGRPGRCFAWQDQDRGRIPLHSQSMTGVWTDRIERRAVFKAMFDRRSLGRLGHAARWCILR